MIKLVWPTVTEIDDDGIWEWYCQAIDDDYLMAPAHTIEEAAQALEDAGLIQAQRREQ